MLLFEPCADVLAELVECELSGRVRSAKSRSECLYARIESMHSTRWSRYRNHTVQAITHGSLHCEGFKEVNSACTNACHNCCSIFCLACIDDKINLFVPLSVAVVSR